MALDPDVAKVLELVEKAGYPELSALSPAAARAQFDKLAPTLDAPPEAVYQAEDRRIGGPDADIPVRVYWPREPRMAAPLPVLLWLHGGGWVVGSLQSYDAVCRVLTNLADCIVVSVDYRLAPEHPFPAAPDDCAAAWRWLQANATTLGGDPDRLAIGGDSAGGNLTAATALAARDAGGTQPVCQLLIYPATAPAPDSPSHRAFAEGYLLTRRNVLWFYAHYTAGRDLSADPRFAPLVAPDLSRLPPALVLVAEHDPLRDEGIAYAERLMQAGNRVDLAYYEGQVHGFLSLSGAVHAGRQALRQAAFVLHTAFGTAEPARD